LKVLYVFADTPHEWNCSEWNCIIPTKAINETKEHTAEAIHINEFVQNTERAQKLVNEADIIIIERNFFGDTLTIMQYWKVRNKNIVAIFDDAYDIMHPQNPSYPFWTIGELKFKDAQGNEGTTFMKPPPIEQFKWGLNMVKGVQVPSKYLAKDWSKYNKTYYVHNFLDMHKYMNVRPLYPHPKEEIIVGWCGSMSHYASFHDSGVIQGLVKAARKHPNMKVLIGGDKRLFDMLEVENKVFQPYVPHPQWVELLKTIDIGLAPLAGEYDKRRSWIKGMEYMALKIPWIATKYPTYDELYDYGLMIENGKNSWGDAISDMIVNIDEYRAKAKGEPYDFAVENSAYRKVEEVTIPLYEKLIDMPYPAEINWKELDEDAGVIK